MKSWKRAAALALSAALILSVASGCSRKKDPEPTDTPAPTVTPTAEPTPTQPQPPAPERETVRLGLYRSAGALGTVKLLADSDAGETSAAIQVSVAGDPSEELLPALRAGELELAVLPTNLAAALYNEDSNSIRLLAITGTGGLRLLENGSSVHSLSDLVGKTVYSVHPDSHTQHVFHYLLAQSGLNPERDVKLEFRSEEWVAESMLHGDIDLCLLPTPLAEEVLAQGGETRAVLELSEVWSQAAPDSECLTGCLVARTDWLREHGPLASELLQGFSDSTDYVTAAPQASEMLVRYGLVSNEAAAAAALAQPGPVWVTGSDMLTVSDYFAALFSDHPASIGGGIPDDTFYYLP